jgi:hypothetical protein
MFARNRCHGVFRMIEIVVHEVLSDHGRNMLKVLPLRHWRLFTV